MRKDSISWMMLIICAHAEDLLYEMDDGDDFEDLDSGHERQLITKDIEFSNVLLCEDFKFSDVARRPSPLLCMFNETPTGVSPQEYLCSKDKCATEVVGCDQRTGHECTCEDLLKEPGACMFTPTMCHQISLLNSTLVSLECGCGRAGCSLSHVCIKETQLCEPSACPYECPYASECSNKTRRCERTECPWGCPQNAACNPETKQCDYVPILETYGTKWWLTLCALLVPIVSLCSSVAYVLISDVIRHFFFPRFDDEEEDDDDDGSLNATPTLRSGEETEDTIVAL